MIMSKTKILSFFIIGLFIGGSLASGLPFNVALSLDDTKLDSVYPVITVTSLEPFHETGAFDKINPSNENAMMVSNSISLKKQNMLEPRSESTSELVTFYFKDYLDRTDSTPYDSSGLFPLISIVPPVSSDNAYYPPRLFNEFPINHSRCSFWLYSWMFQFLDWDDIFEEFEELIEAMKFILPHPLRIIESYDFSGDEPVFIQGDVVFNLNFRSRFGFKKGHDDHIQVSLYRTNPYVVFPILIKNMTTIIEQRMLPLIQSQTIILEDVNCIINPNQILLFSIEIIPTNRFITSYLAREETIYYLISSKISTIIMNVLKSSNNQYIKEMYFMSEDFQNLMDELNFTRDNYETIADALLAPSLVYDSFNHPSSVTVPFLQ